MASPSNDDILLAQKYLNIKISNKTICVCRIYGLCKKEQNIKLNILTSLLVQVD